MHYVILRDDDTNALTPVECLERLYRPFLDRGLPINLAVIPEVRTDVALANGEPEGFLFGNNGHAPATLPIRSNETLVQYLQANPGYHILQHGCHHDYFEFDGDDRPDILRRLDQGTRNLTEAGFRRPQTFVAPYDKLSDVSLLEVAKHFCVISTGWFELRRLPFSWWPRYCLKKLRRAPHWQVRRTTLLSHPGCLLSCNRCYDTMLDQIKDSVVNQRLTILVTHWWEYFRKKQPDERFIQILHQTADYLASEPDIRVIAFEDLLNPKVPLN
jgi:Uncharacterized protein conserved in bacteria (DUF2334)